MIAAWAFCADGGSCFATTVKMYDAASAAVRLANTGPDCLPSDWTAARPRSASAAVRGCQPLFVEVAVSTVVVVVDLDAGTRAYQYHAATQIRMMITRQPIRRRNPFMFPGGRLSTRENTPAQPVHASCPGHPFRNGRRRPHAAIQAS